MLELVVVLFSLLDLLSVEELAALFSEAVVLPLSLLPFSLFPFSLLAPSAPLLSCEPFAPARLLPLLWSVL